MCVGSHSLHGLLPTSDLSFPPGIRKYGHFPHLVALVDFVARELGAAHPVFGNSNLLKIGKLAREMQGRAFAMQLDNELHSTWAVLFAAGLLMQERMDLYGALPQPSWVKRKRFK